MIAHLQHKVDLSKQYKITYRHDKCLIFVNDNNLNAEYLNEGLDMT